MLDLNKNDVVPLVTVAMPVYNGGEYLRLAVLSLVKQTFTKWELIIIDDGSTDDALVEISDIVDPRIRIVRDGQNKGLAVRLNECIDLARGQYLARMDHDDISYPERFMQQVVFLEQNPALDLVAVRAITIDENDRVLDYFPFAITHNEICAQPWQGFYFPHPTWMGKIEWFRKYRYTVPAPYFCEDQELLLRSYRASKFATLDEILFAYRVRSTVNWGKLARTRRAVFAAQLQHFFKWKLWHYALLASAMFVIKMGWDLLKRIDKGGFRFERHIDDEVVSKWNWIVEGLKTEAKLP